MTPGHIQIVLDRLDQVRRNGSGWIARCPAHDDRNPSLSIGTGHDERILVNCHAGCSPVAVVEAIGLTMRDLFPPPDTDWPHHPKLGQPIRAWTYHDAEGRECFKKFRFLPTAHEKKPFRFYHEGRWSRPKDRPSPLYREPKVTAAPSDTRILLAEGEKDAERLERLGYVATTNAEGATTWKSHYTATLRGRRIVMPIDHDEAGYDRLNRVGAELLKAGCDVSYVEFRGNAKGFDVSDFLDSHSKEDLDGLIERATLFQQPIESPFGRNNTKEIQLDEGPRLPGRVKAEIKKASDLAKDPPPETIWLLFGLFAIGALILLTGAPKGGGKTTFLTHALAAIINSRRFLGFKTRPATVLYLSEQGRSFEEEYLKPVGLHDSDQLNILYSFKTTGYDWAYVVQDVIDHCLEHGIEILVVDTISDFAALAGDSENSSGAVLEALKPLKHAAQEHGLTIILVHHDRKGGGNIEDSGRGSNSFAQVVDVIINLKRSTVSESARELNAIGRFGNLVSNLVIEKTEDGYENHGAANSIASTKAKNAVLEHLPTSESAAIDIKNLLAVIPDKTGFGEQTLRNVLDSLVENGTIQTTGRGVRNDPRRYWREIRVEDNSIPPTSKPIGVGIKKNGVETSTGELFGWGTAGQPLT